MVFSQLACVLSIVVTVKRLHTRTVSSVVQNNNYISIMLAISRWSIDFIPRELDYQIILNILCMHLMMCLTP